MKIVQKILLPQMLTFIILALSFSLSDFLSFSLPQYFSVYFLKNKKIILYNYSIIFKTGKLTWTVRSYSNFVHIFSLKIFSGSGIYPGTYILHLAAMSL